MKPSVVALTPLEALPKRASDLETVSPYSAYSTYSTQSKRTRPDDLVSSLVPSDVVKYHLGMLRRSSSILRRCAERKVLRTLQGFLDSYSHFDAQRVITRIAYDADLAIERVSSAAEKLLEREGSVPVTPYPQAAVARRYTITHADETGVLTTSVGSDYNWNELNSLKQRLFRDRVLGELVVVKDSERAHEASNDASHSLHLYAYVAGKRLIWPCPPAVRSYIFQRDMNLVVESILHADAGLEAIKDDTVVYVHLESDSHEDLNEVVVFAETLGDRSTWALGASDSSKLRLTNFWDKLSAALYSWAVLRKDKKNDECGEACYVSCSLDSKDYSTFDGSLDE